MRNTKIVCTLGPASDGRETIQALTDAGMSVARVNGNHGTPDHRRDVIDRVRAVDAASNRSVAVLHDLPGPKIRTVPMDGTIQLAVGSTVRYIKGAETTGDTIGLSHDITAVSAGDRVLLDDGRIETTVDSVDDGVVTATVRNSEELSGRKGVIVPGVELGLPQITERDKGELDVAAEKSVDFVAASFVRDGESVETVSAALADRGAEIPVIAKIERGVAVRNLAGIIEAADGVMVARGDLGVELPLEDVPILQKRIIRTCQRAGVPVITATEMLESMITNRRPTRAEASDVANAVMDGTDAVMLSGETAVGDHPVTVVDTMDRIVRRVEGTDESAEAIDRHVPPVDETRMDALANAARPLGRDVDARALVVATESGTTARKAAKFRPPLPIVASTPDDTVRRQLTLSWDTVPVTAPYASGQSDAVVDVAVRSALETTRVDGGDTVIVIAGTMSELDEGNPANTLKIHTAEDGSVDHPETSQ
jgi:pyruvate kinase